MNYGTAENEIITRLNTQIVLAGVTDKYEAVPLPETEAEFREIQKKVAKAVIAVQFIDAVPQPSNTTDVVSQEEIVRFRTTFATMRMRGAGGMFAAMELTKLILIGYRLPSAMTRLTFVKYGQLQDEQNGLQTYFEFECKATNVQAFNDNSFDEPIGGPIKIKFPPETFGPEFDETQFE